MGVRWLEFQRSELRASLDAEMSGRGPHSAGAALFGPAGVGKTVLARGAAQRFTEGNRDGVLHWVTATASARPIPFGAFSHLVDVAPGKDPSAVLAAARTTLCPPGRRVLIVVDDAHLLDGHSAALVHQLATATAGLVLITCRSGEQVADAITALWKDDAIVRLDVAPLIQAEVTQLVERVLDGPVVAETAERIFDLSLGNPLYLRHLVEGAVAHGTLLLVDGSWEWRGETVLTERLTELVDASLIALPGEARRVLEYLAVDEPLPVAVLTALAGVQAVEAAERATAVRVTTRGEEFVVHPFHPLYTERCRAALGSLATRRLRTELVRSLRSAGAGNVSDRLRWMALALDSDAPPDAADLLGAAWQAVFLGDFALTERLAQAALRDTDIVLARVLLAQALSWQGRGVEAEAVLDAVDPDALSPFELQYWVLSKATNEFWMLRRAAPAARWLDQHRQRLSEPAALPSIDGLAAQFAMNLGELDRCVQLASSVLLADGAEDLAVAWAAAAAALARARMGRLERVDELVERCASVVAPDGVRFNAALARVQAMVLTGSVARAREIAEQHVAISEFRQPSHSSGLALRGYALLVAGQLPEAVEALEAASAYFADSGDSWGALTLAWLATALGQSGDPVAARDALMKAQSAFDDRIRIHEPEVLQARVWALAAAGELPAACSAAHDTIANATSSGQRGIALLAHLDATRLGDTSALDELRRLVDEVDCALGRTVLAHAQALHAGDGTGLRDAGGRFESFGMLCAAADAAAHAAHAYATADQRTEELAARATAARLRRACGDATTPALAAVLRPTPLTNREREIALLVAAGKTNRAIAEHLTISVRTVEVHVYRACVKLNVPNRTELARTAGATRTSRR